MKMKQDKSKSSTKLLSDAFENKSGKKNKSMSKKKQPDIEHVTSNERNSSVDGVHKRKVNREAIKASKTSQLKPAGGGPYRLLLRNLPPSIDYGTLKDKVPHAHHIRLFKKGSKRHAFATFHTSELCELEAENLNGISIDDFPIRVTLVSSTAIVNSKEPQDVAHDQTLTISNLPFQMTKAELEEEFPTASDIVMNVNKIGRFRGSCVLQFDMVDDCKICSDACRGRKVGNRIIKVRPGLHFDPRQLERDAAANGHSHFCVKVTGIPNNVEKEQLESIFPNKDDVGLLKVNLSLNVEGTHKTAVLSFNSKTRQKAALFKFTNEKIFGRRLRARPWSFHSNRVRSKQLIESRAKAQTSDQSLSANKSSRKRLHSQIDTSVTVDDHSTASNKKSKHEYNVQPSTPLLHYKMVDGKNPTHVKFTSESSDESVTATPVSSQQKKYKHSLSDE